MLMLFSVLDSTKNPFFIGIKQFRVLVRTGPRFSRETRHIEIEKYRIHRANSIELQYFYSRE